MHLPTQKRSTAVLSPFPELRWDADRLFSEMFGRPQVRVAPGGPEADFFETENEFVLEMDLPGFTNESVDVTVEKGVMTIHGERSLERDEEKDSYHLRERSWGKFSRSFSIPHTIDSESVDASFNRGVLTVKLPQAGALDVTRHPSTMKKGRVGTRIEVLCPTPLRDTIVDLLMRETTTFGVRVEQVERRILERSVREVETKYGKIRVKDGFRGDTLIKTVPEFESCRAAADRHGVAVTEVYDETIEKSRS